MKFGVGTKKIIGARHQFSRLDMTLTTWKELGTIINAINLFAKENLSVFQM
jgi:hypothetical protein